MKIEFFNDEKSTEARVINSQDDSALKIMTDVPVEAVGIARRHKEDPCDPNLGMAIAACRALGFEVSDDYLKTHRRDWLKNDKQEKSRTHKYKIGDIVRVDESQGHGIVRIVEYLCSDISSVIEQGYTVQNIEAFSKDVHRFFSFDSCIEGLFFLPRPHKFKIGDRVHITSANYAREVSNEYHLTDHPKLYADAFTDLLGAYATVVGRERLTGRYILTCVNHPRYKSSDRIAIYPEQLLPANTKIR